MTTPNTELKQAYRPWPVVDGHIIVGPGNKCLCGMYGGHPISCGDLLETSPEAFDATQAGCSELNIPPTPNTDGPTPAPVSSKLGIEPDISPARTPNPKLPPLSDGPKRKMIIEIEVSADFEKRLDNQWMVEREIHADRWSWTWADKQVQLLNRYKAALERLGSSAVMGAIPFAVTDSPASKELLIRIRFAKKTLNPEQEPEPASDGWNPMETAPLNQQWVIIRLKDGAIHRAHFFEMEEAGFKGWFIEGPDSMKEIETPVAWRPEP